MTEARRLCACPACFSALRWEEAAVCESCAARYPIVDGVPTFAPLAGVDGDQKQRQAAFFDAEATEEFEIERPTGAPPLYRWLLEEKLRRSIAGVRPLLRGATALVVCGGSGMEAEFLAREGAEVVTADLSLGAARRAAERARRHGFDVLSIQADVERLPFRDRSIDVVYVHDGLHHIERPLAGLAEMARVAAVAVSVTEPARAALTAAAVRFGIALEVEEAGNRVARLSPDEVTAELASNGFRSAVAERYAMYYRHEPGPVMRALSRRAVLPLVKGALRSLDPVGRRVGNKLTVQAVRPERLRVA